MACRAAGTVFATTVYLIDAGPWPFWSPDSPIQFASAPADHVQSRSAEIASVPLPPDAGKFEGDAVAVT